MNKQVARLRNFLYQQRWLVVAALIFIAWKFLLIGIMWHDRYLPPEPDDALIYSGQIYSVSRCPTIICDYPAISLSNTSGYTYLSYRLFFGTLNKLLPVSPVIFLEMSYYIGTVLMAGAAAYLISQLTSHPKQQFFVFLILSLFYGGGIYHGFFWVVPSFFAVLLLLTIIALIVDGQRTTPGTLATLAGLAILLVFTHPLGFYFLFLPPLLAFFMWVLNDRPPLLLRKVFITTIVGSCVYVGLIAHVTTSIIPASAELDTIKQNLYHQTATPNPSTTSPPLSTSTSSSWKIFYTDYVKYLFPVWPAILIFATFLVFIARFGSRRLLALYAASLLLTVLSLAHPIGYRMLIVLWPVTYLLYGFGFWHAWQLVTRRHSPTQRLGQLTIGCFLFIFIIINVIYSITFSLTLQQNEDQKTSGEAVAYLLAHTAPSDPILPENKLIMAHFLNTELILRPPTNTTHDVLYRVDLIEPDETNSEQLPIDTFFSTASRILGKASENVPKERENKAAIQAPESPPHTVLEKQFGQVYIYRNTAYEQ